MPGLTHMHNVPDDCWEDFTQENTHITLDPGPETMTGTQQMFLLAILEATSMEM